MQRVGLLKTACAAAAVLFSAAAVLLSADAACAATTAKQKNDQLAVKSAFLGTTFPDKPYSLNDSSDTYAAFMYAVAKDLGRQCKGLESYGWDLKVGDQSRLTQIVDATMNAVQKDGFKATEVKPKSTEGANTVAIAVEKAKKTGLMLWAPVGKGVVLLVCESAPGK